MREDSQKLQTTWQKTTPLQELVQGDSSFIARAKTHISNRFKILKKFRNDYVTL
jgi:hypothetical protein